MSEILEALVLAANTTSDYAINDVNHHLGHGDPMSTAVFNALRGQYTVGLLVGLQIAIADIAAGRQLVAFIERDFLDRDELAMEPVELLKQDMLRVLK